MITITGDNIISPLGFSAETNYQQVKNGASAIARHEGTFGIPEPFMAALIDVEQINEAFNRIASHDVAKRKPTDYTLLERMAIVSAYSAIADADIDPQRPSTVFILSSTKGNVEYIEENIKQNIANDDRLYLWHSAKRIAEFLGIKQHVVVSNACISGAHALWTAARAIMTGSFDTAVVTGVDRLSKFIVSGFQSFKALSGDVCRPFDVSRTGLNLGEAAATIVLQAKDAPATGSVTLEEGAIRNDANHISGPSRTGEGLFLALQRIMRNCEVEDIAFVNAHGTATPYNDEMESIALHRAGLDIVPVNALKACFGHTLGAAGILESIISARALQDSIALKTQGFMQSGTSFRLQVTTTNQTIAKKRFIKMLSGFGGCNAALLFKKI